MLSSHHSGRRRTAGPLAACGLAVGAAGLCATTAANPLLSYTVVLAGVLALDNAVFAATGLVACTNTNSPGPPAAGRADFSMLAARWALCCSGICSAFGGLYTLQLACASEVAGAGSDVLALLVFAPLPVGLAAVLAGRELLGWLYVDLLGVDVMAADAPLGSCMARQAVLPPLPACVSPGLGRPALQLWRAPGCGLAQWRPPPGRAELGRASDKAAAVGLQLATVGALWYGGQAVADGGDGPGWLLLAGGVGAVGLSWIGRVAGRDAGTPPGSAILASTSDSGGGGGWAAKAMGVRAGELIWLGCCRAVESRLVSRAAVGGGDPLSGCTVAALLQVDGTASMGGWGLVVVGAVAAIPVAVVALQCAASQRSSSASGLGPANGLGEHWAPWCFPCFAAAVMYGLALRSQLKLDPEPFVLPIPAAAVAGLLAVTVVLFAALRRSDPGWVLTARAEHGPVGPAGGREFCSVCGTSRPATAHHCRFCKRCVDGRDHHCHFTKNCVGWCGVACSAPGCRCCILTVLLPAAVSLFLSFVFFCPRSTQQERQALRDLQSGLPRDGSGCPC